MKRRTKLLASLAISVMPDRIKPALYRAAFGARVGKDVKIGFGSVVMADDMELGDGTRIGALSFIDARQLITGQHAKIGNLSRITVARAEIKSRATVDSRVEIRGDTKDAARGSITLGRDSWVFPHCHVNVSRPVTLGKNVGVGGGSYIFTHGYWLSQLDGFPVKYAPVTIGDDTWLPWGCFVMPGVDIGKRVIVGARSVVNKSVPDDAMVAGSPAKVIRDRSSVDVTLEQKIAMLVEVTEEHARYEKALFSRQGDLLSLDARPLIALHRATPAAPRTDVLNVVPGAFDASLAQSAPCLFLEGYGSSSASLFDARMLAWLTFARRIGLRFYPWDET